MKRACVIGWPIAHSRSPLIHNFWLRLYGIEGSYTKEAVLPKDLNAFLASLEVQGFAGCNVTVPHKEKTFAAAVIHDPSATAVGAANTVWFENGRLACANTDTYGFMANLDATAPQWRENGGPVLVLGAGGSARAVVYGLLQAGRKDIRVFNRSLERATELATHFGNDVTPLRWDERNDHVSNAALIINTTTLGLNGDGNPEIDFANAPKTAVAADLVYVPLGTPFLRSAREQHLGTVDGLGMLLHQAVPGFEKWFGVRPDVTPALHAHIVQEIGGS